MHHALLYIGDPKLSLASIEEGDRTPGADVFLFSVDRFGIDDARRLKELAFQRPVERAVRSFIISTKNVSAEAQNALLKLFEEPPATARFYILVPREDLLISTLRSRLARPIEHMRENVPEEATEFLGSSYAKRMEEIRERIENKDDGWVEDVLTGVEIHAATSGDHEALREIEFVRRYVFAPGASKKMLLEHLALTLSIPD